MLGFFASHAPACRQASMLWNGLYDEFISRDLELIAVTRHTKHGFLPKDAEDVTNTGSARHGMTPEDFFEHVEQYHTNVGLKYPMVVVDEAVFKAYHILPLPTVVLIGRDGRVAMIATSHEENKLVEFGLRHLLSKKAE
jgi:hypothetical protein